MAVQCPRCGRESTGAEYCGACGASLREAAWVPRSAGGRPRVTPNTPFAVALVLVHAAAWLLIASSESIWRGLGFACAAAFLIGLLAGALRLMDPMDPDALGEPVTTDPLLVPTGLGTFLLGSLIARREQVPVLVLSLLFALIATPVAGLLVYLVFGCAKACIDSRVVALYGLVIVSALVLALPAPGPLTLTFRLYSTLMLPCIMLGWALSSFFRSGAW